MNQELKPCPFCGCEAVVRAVNGYWQAHCGMTNIGFADQQEASPMTRLRPMCFARTSAYRTEAEASEAWNRRVSSGSQQKDQELPEVRHGWAIVRGVECVECPGCGFTMDAAHTDDSPTGGYSCPICERASSVVEAPLDKGLTKDQAKIGAGFLGFMRGAAWRETKAEATLAEAAEAAEAYCMEYSSLGRVGGDTEGTKDSVGEEHQG